MNRLLHFFAFCVLGVGFYAAAEAQTIVTFDVPGAGTGANQGTVAFGINTPGAIIGSYINSSYTSHGFMRAKNGVITTFDAPGAGTGSFQGTIPLLNNAADAITGYYIDAAGAVHGFLRTEHCHEKCEEEHCEAGDSETIPSPDSALQIDDLISTRDRAEITAGFGLTSDAATNINSCPRPLCGLHTNGKRCGFYVCYRGRIGPLYSGYDLTYKRACYYHGVCGSDRTTQ